MILSETAAWVLLANALVLASLFGAFLRLQADGDGYRKLFRCLSLSLAVVMSVIMIDGIALSYMTQL